MLAPSSELRVPSLPRYKVYFIAGIFCPNVDELFVLQSCKLLALSFMLDHLKCRGWRFESRLEMSLA